MANNPAATTLRPTNCPWANQRYARAGLQHQVMQQRQRDIGLYRHAARADTRHVLIHEEPLLPVRESRT